MKNILLLIAILLTASCANKLDFARNASITQIEEKVFKIAITTGANPTADNISRRENYLQMNAAATCLKYGYKSYKIIKEHVYGNKTIQFGKSIVVSCDV